MANLSREKEDRIPIYVSSPRGWVIGKGKLGSTHLPFGFSNEWENNDSNYQKFWGKSCFGGPVMKVC